MKKESNEKKHNDLNVDNDIASGAKLSNDSTCLYKTQGTIASIDLIGRSFTIEPVSPYAFDQKKGDTTEKCILFVSEAEDKDSGCRDAKMLAIHQVFALPGKIDLCTVIALKNGRDKIELCVNSFDGKENNLSAVSLKILK